MLIKQVLQIAAHFPVPKFQFPIQIQLTAPSLAGNEAADNDHPYCQLEDDPGVLAHKLAKILTCFSTHKIIPRRVFASLEEKLVHFKEALNILAALGVIQIGWRGEILGVQGRTVRVMHLQWEEGEEVRVIGVVLKLLSPFITKEMKDELFGREVIPHALEAWEKAMGHSKMLKDYIYFPSHLINKIQRSRMNAMYLRIALGTYRALRLLKGKRAFWVIRFGLHVETAYRCQNMLPEAHGAVRKIYSRALKRLGKDHWLTVEINKDYVVILKSLRNYHDAYNHQLLICQHYVTTYGDTSGTVLEFFIKAKLLYRLTKFSEAEGIFRTVLEWNEKKKNRVLAEKAHFWLQRCLESQKSKPNRQILGLKSNAISMLPEVYKVPFGLIKGQ
jgi:tetratricopeptide (TPR) repeat protein